MFQTIVSGESATGNKFICLPPHPQSSDHQGSSGITQSIQTAISYKDNACNKQTELYRYTTLNIYFISPFQSGFPLFKLFSVFYQQSIIVLAGQRSMRKGIICIIIGLYIVREQLSVSCMIAKVIDFSRTADQVYKCCDLNMLPALV